MSNYRLLLENREILRRAQKSLNQWTPRITLKMWLLYPRGFHQRTPLEELQDGNTGRARLYAMVAMPGYDSFDPDKEYESYYPWYREY